MLTESERQAFDDDGLLVLPGFFDETEIDALRTRMDHLVAAFDPAEASTIFSTTDRSHASDEWFLESGDKIRFFFEDGALDASGRLTVAMDRALNKVGHAMHDLDPVFSAFSRKPAPAEVARDIGMTDPRLLQSMYIFKQPRIGGEVIWHTDHPFLWTDPPSVRGFWVAVDDATVDNGCLWALPGQHRLAPKERFRRSPVGGTVTEVLDPTPFPTAEGVPLEAASGTLVVLHGLLPHWSAPNTSDRSRHAYTLHCIDGSAHYPADNWLQRSPDMPLRGFADD